MPEIHRHHRAPEYQCVENEKKDEEAKLISLARVKLGRIASSVKRSPLGSKHKDKESMGAWSVGVKLKEYTETRNSSNTTLIVRAGERREMKEHELDR